MHTAENGHSLVRAQLQLSGHFPLYIPAPDLGRIYDLQRPLSTLLQGSPLHPDKICHFLSVNLPVFVAVASPTMAEMEGKVGRTPLSGECDTINPASNRGLRAAS